VTVEPPTYFFAYSGAFEKKKFETVWSSVSGRNQRARTWFLSYTYVDVTHPALLALGTCLANTSLLCEEAVTFIVQVYEQSTIHTLPFPFDKYRPSIVIFGPKIFSKCLYAAQMANNSSDLSAEEESPSKKVTLRGRLLHFTWAWFDCTMSTGALASLLGQQSNSFPGLKTIGKVVFIIDIILFVAMCILISTRFILNPRAFTKSLHHPFESFYFGAFWVSIALILYCTQQYGVPSCGPWLVKALEVSYWTYAGCALLVAVFQYHVIFDEEKLPVFEAMPAWILPAYPFIVLGPLAGVLLYSQPKSAALPILIGGLMFQGLGWMIALIMYTIYFTRLINSNIPEEPKRAGMYIAVGPAGKTPLSSF
jgi:hypothetical protein